MYNNLIVYRYIDPKEVVLNKNNVTEYIMSYVVDVKGLTMLLNNPDNKFISINIKDNTETI